MAAEVSSQREKQEQSIKARKHELFVGEAAVEQGEPRKKFREVLRETPAAPLSKNVKLILWGSAAPVVFLFVTEMLTIRSSAKAPEGSVLVNVVKPLAPPVVKKSDEPPAAPATEAKPEEPKPEAAAATSEKPPEKEKPKNNKGKGKGKGKPKDKPKDDSTIAKIDEPAKGDQSKEGEPKKTSKSGSSAKGDKDKGSMASTQPEKKRRAPMLVKKKKEYNPAYPKREGEKKDDSKTKPDSGSNEH